MSSSGSLYWRIEEGIKQIESDAFSVIGADGSLFAVRRSAHVIVPDDIIDDFYVSMKVVINGLRVARAPEALAFERSATSTADEFHRKIRIACQAFNVHRLIWPEIRRRPLLAYCYVSHRLLKWLIGYNLVLAGLFFVLALLMVFPAVPVLVLHRPGGAGVRRAGGAQGQAGPPGACHADVVCRYGAGRLALGAGRKIPDLDADAERAPDRPEPDGMTGLLSAPKQCGQRIKLWPDRCALLHCSKSLVTSSQAGKLLSIEV